MKKKSIRSALPSPPAVRSQETLKIPALLFEGDQDPETASPSVSAPQSQSGARVALMPRDPHSVYAHWELTPAQKRQLSKSSVPGSLFLNLHRENAEGPLAARITVGLESNHAFIHLAAAGTQYVAELGHFDSSNQWVPLATSAPVITPRDTLSIDTTVQFAEMPPALPTHRSRSPAPIVPVPREQPVETIKAAGETKAREQRAAFLVPPPSVSWIPALPDKRESQGEKISETNYLRELLSSSNPIERGSDYPAATTETPPTTSERGSIDLEQLLQTTFEQLKAGNSSPLGAEPISSSFFLTVGTELLLHGTTHPDAQLTVSGQPIQLRPDGTFTCRFALPEGELALNVEAVSLTGDFRRANLKVLRESK